MTLLLAVETSTAEFGIALADGSRIVAERTRRRDRDHPGIGAAAAELLADAGIAITALDRLAVDVGPGNLGTVRSGIAYVNGLAFALGLRVAGVDALDLLALDAPGEPVLSLRNAGGADVYAALTRPDGSVTRTVGRLTEVVPALVAGLPRVSVVGARQAEAVAALAGIEVRTSPLEAPTVQHLVAAAIARDPGTDVAAVSPLTETSPHYAGTRAAAPVLLAGGVVLLPTDTVYGLAVHPERPEAAERLFRMKGRPGGRNLPIMAASVADAEKLGARVTPEAGRLFAAFAPGPITVAMGVDPGAAPEWLAGRDEIAVRIPAEPALLALLESVGPLLVTSANAHGVDTPPHAPDVLDQLVEPPDLVIDDGPRPVVPSTLVNCNLPRPAVERVGVVPEADILEALA